AGEAVLHAVTSDRGELARGVSGDMKQSVRAADPKLAERVAFEVFAVHADEVVDGRHFSAGGFIETVEEGQLVSDDGPGTIPRIGGQIPGGGRDGARQRPQLDVLKARPAAFFPHFHESHALFGGYSQQGVREQVY